MAHSNPHANVRVDTTIYTTELGSWHRRTYVDKGDTTYGVDTQVPVSHCGYHTRVRDFRDGTVLAVALPHNSTTDSAVAEANHNSAVDQVIALVQSS